MKIAVLYIRVSTEEQSKQGISIETQLNTCMDFATKNGYCVKNVYVEEGLSAKNLNRKQVQELLKYCENAKNKINAVIVWRVDRLSRFNVDYHGTIRPMLIKNNILLLSATELNVNTIEGDYIVDFALYTGLRKENILELQWYQINFDLNIIEILNNKGNKHIILPLTEPCRELLESLKSKQTSEYVFINPETNKRWYSIDRAWQKARDAAGLHDFRFHDLRHTVGTRLAKKGVPINVIQEILAHSDIRTTMQYVHCTEGSKLEALNSIL